MDPIRVGERYDRLVIVEDLGQILKCQCDCGKPHTVRRWAWRRTQSCGCGRREFAASLNTRHGMSGTPTWRSWSSMINRTTKPYAADYERYGGRGITVCDRWLVFENFLADMGERPEDRTLDRIDVDGNYEPSNCRWATIEVQQTNRRVRTHCKKRGHELTEDNVYREKDGRRRCLACRRLRKRTR